MNEEIKKKILNKGIIKSEEDWNRASSEHLELAALFLLLSESSFLQDEPDPTEEDKIVFLNETSEINDLCELRDVDKVLPNKTFESDAIPIGVPVKILPLIRQIYGDMRKDSE